MSKLSFEVVAVTPQLVSPWMAAAIGMGAAMVLPWMTSYLKGGE